MIFVKKDIQSQICKFLLNCFWAIFLLSRHILKNKKFLLIRDCHTSSDVSILRKKGLGANLIDLTSELWFIFGAIQIICDTIREGPCQCHQMTHGEGGP